MTDPSIRMVRCAQAGTPSSGCPPAAGACATVARAGQARATVALAVSGAWLRAGCPAGPGGLDGAGRVAGGCLRSRAGGQLAPPAGSRAGRHCPRQRRGWAGGHPPGPRARPCRPFPPAGPGRRPGTARPQSRDVPPA